MASHDIHRLLTYDCPGNSGVLVDITGKVGKSVSGRLICQKIDHLCTFILYTFSSCF